MCNQVLLRERDMWSVFNEKETHRQLLLKGDVWLGPIWGGCVVGPPRKRKSCYQVLSIGTHGPMLFMSEFKNMIIITV